MWFIISIIAFFLLALAAVIDKFLLTKTRIVPASFAFFICLGGVLSTVLLIFEETIIFPQDYLIQMIIGGASLFFSLYFMFKAVAVSEVSKVNPLIFSFMPVAVFILSIFLGLELIDFKKILGSIIIVVGSYYLSQVGQLNDRLNKKVWLYILLASILFGASNTFSKIAYDNVSFITAFVAIRWLALITAVIMITILGKWRQVFLKNKEKQKEQVKVKFAIIVLIIGQTAGALGVILQQYAINLGNVILVSALSGLQFFFVIFIVYIFSKFFPKIVKEDIKQKYIIKKIIFSLVLFLGIALILI